MWSISVGQAAAETPVLIIGGGPTGLLQAHLLSNLGVKCIIVERYPKRLGVPKAHALSPRSLEICRQANLDVTKIRCMGTARQDAFWVNFLTNLSGESVGRLPYERMDVDVLDVTPEMIHNIPQPTFEQFLTDSLANNDLVEVRKGVSFVSLEQTADSVSTTVENLASGEQTRIKSRYVVACDGAKSKVCDFLGILSDGEEGYETMMTIHFNADLRSIVGTRVGMLHWLMDPAVSGFIIAYDLSGNAVLISNLSHPVESWNSDLSRQVVEGALGKSVPFDILSYRPWLLSRKVARQYRHGNVFLAGDAAHSFPPTGGLGLNSGLGDVHNLAFKLAYVLKDDAPDSFLDTYEVERRQVALVNSAQSVKNGQKIFNLLKTMGSTGENIVEARANLYARIADTKNRRAIDEGIEDQREHFDNLELHIGYVYGDKVIPPHASHYTPRFVPGARLPHCWIKLHEPPMPPVDVSYVREFSSEEIAKRRYSILDLIDANVFTLVGGPVVQNVPSYLPGRDFEVIGEPGSAWLAQSGIRDGGVILVRPDQHILAVWDRQISATEVEAKIREFLKK